MARGPIVVQLRGCRLFSIGSLNSRLSRNTGIVSIFAIDHGGVLFGSWYHLVFSYVLAT